jgi:Cupin domain
MLESKNIDTPDEKVSTDHGEMQIVNLPGFTLVRATFRPGWSWSADVRPKAGTDSCQVAHAGVVLAGHFAVRTEDGEENVLGPGDAHVVSPGHDAWVVGDEPCVILDVSLSGEASA